MRRMRRSVSCRCRGKREGGRLIAFFAVAVGDQVTKVQSSLYGGNAPGYVGED